eukprot:PRCOL_00007005-RA
MMFGGRQRYGYGRGRGMYGRGNDNFMLLMLLMRVFEALNRLPFKPVASLCLLVPPVLLHVGGDGLTDLLGELLLGRRASDGFGLGWVSSMCLNPADFFGYGYGVEGGGGGGGSPWPARLLLPLLATRGVYHLYYETVSLCQKGFNLELALGTKRFGALLFLCCVATQTLYVAAAGTLATLGLFEGIYWDECCMGYTGVIFALKVVAGKVAGTRREGFFFFSVESKWAAWLELGLVHFLHPQSSLLNHVCGIVVGNGIVRLAPELAGLPPRQLDRLDGVAPKSPAGEMLAYIRESEPHLFETTVEQTLERLVDAADEDGQAAAGAGDAGEAAGAAAGESLSLYRRMADVKRAERSRAVSDVLYQSVLYKFDTLGSPLLTRAQLELAPGLEGGSLSALTQGVHSTEALDMVRTHLMGILGPNMPQSEYGMQTTAVRISKLQAAQVYAASVMFGYFLRRVDKRFQMEKQFGTFKKSTDATVAMLEELFRKSADSTDDPDVGATKEDGGAAAAEGGADAQSQAESADGAPSLAEYVEGFDRQTLVETAQMVSIEGVNLLQEYTASLFGSVQELQTEMQEVMEGGDFDSPEAMMERMQEAIANEEVQAMTFTFSDQRRVILEAVAFGSFLRDSEAYVELEAAELLTPTARRRSTYCHYFLRANAT